MIPDMQFIQVQKRLAKNAHLLMVPLVLYVIVRGLVGAATQPLAFDEILTKIVASQPGLKGIWAALSKAVDGQAPAHYVIERWAMDLTNNVYIALRIPSILAMLRYRGTDNVDKVVRSLRGYFPVEIIDYSQFISAHPTFLLYRDDPSSGFEWLPPYLAREGACMQVAALNENGIVYLVTMKDANVPETCR